MSQAEFVRPRRPGRWSALGPILLPFSLTLLVLFGFAAWVIAGTYTVTNTSDFGIGSLRDAIAEANSGTCAAPCVIDFAVTGDITSTSGPFTITASGVTIDGPGPTQVGVTSFTDPVFSVQADDTTIRDLSIFGASGRKVAAGAVNNLVLQNNWIGLTRAGAAGGGTLGVQLTSSTNAIIDSNTISGNTLGVGVELASATGALIQNNFIGTDPTGALPLPNETGILFDTSGNLIGRVPLFLSRRSQSGSGSAEALADERGRRRTSGRQTARPFSDEGAVAPAALPDPLGNIIAFNTGNGIHLATAASSNVIGLNWIHSNGGDGVHLDIDAGDGNVIAENSIELNGGLGINIVPTVGTDSSDGVLINDQLEPTASANQEMEHPVLVDAVFNGVETVITYTFQSFDAISGTYDFHFYKSPVADPSGFGEGETFIVHSQESYDSINGANTPVTHTAIYPGDARGTWITGTATDTFDSVSTSEFSNAVLVRAVTAAQSDLGLTKTGPPTAGPGGPITWTLTVTNFGPDAASNLVVTDTLPPGAAFQAAGSSSGCALTGTSGGSQIVTCTAASLANGATLAFTIAATAPTVTGPATNTATVSSGSSDPAPNNNNAVFTTNVITAADLKLDKSGPVSAEPGTTFAYTLTVQNLGPSAAPDVTVTDFLPTGMTYVGAPDPNWVCSESSPGIVTCSLLAIPLGSGASSSFMLEVRGPDTQTSLTNTASVASTLADPDPSNNDAAATTTFTSPCTTEPPTLVAPAPGATDVGSPVTFRWLAVDDAIGYQVMITPEDDVTRAIGNVDGSAAAGEEMTVQAPVPPGRIIWWVRALFGFGCRPVDSPQQVFFSNPCPSEAPQLLDVIEGQNGEVTLGWTRVPQALRYHVLVAINGGSYDAVGSVEQVPEGSTPSFTTVVPAGTDISWIIEVEFGGGCPRLRSDPGEFEAPCYPPALSIPGAVTSDREYQVRATIVSEGRTYLFEESTSPLFDRDLVSKLGVLDPDGEYIFAIFEHNAEEPTPFYYRARVNQAGCEFSGSGRIVVIPPSEEIVLQLGLEETVVRQIEVLSPPGPEGSAFMFEVVDDRDWILNVTPSTGTILPNEILVLTVTINPLGLPVGTTTGTVEVEFTPIEPAGKNALSNHTTKTSSTVSVTLVTPVTNKGKGEPAAESLIVPAVAHAAGFNSQWRSDIRLVNLGTASQKYALNFTLSGENGTQTGKSAEIDLTPGATTALNDLVRQWFGLGYLQGENATGVLEIRPLARGAISINQTAVTKTLVSVASSRTFNATPQGTLGQFIPGIPFAGFVGKTPPGAPDKTILSLQQLAQNDGFRTNLGLAEASGNPANVAVRFYDAEGDQLLEVPISLQAGEHLQFNEILKQNGITALDVGRAEIEVVGGDGRITAYASVVDNQTNDPLLVQAVNLAELGADRYVVPGIAHFETGQASWRSDMQIFNAGEDPVQATLAFYRLGETTAAATAQVTVQPGTILTLGDVVPTLFGESDTGGSVHVSTTGTSKLVVTARTYDQTDAGTYGQFIPAVTEAQAFGLGDRPMQVLQMEESANFRTNLGIVEVTGAPVQVELTAHVAESRVTPRVQLTIQGNEFRQLNQVLKSLNVGNTYNTRVALRVIGGQGKIVAYGSAVDNKTQDPTFVPGQ